MSDISLKPSVSEKRQLAAIYFNVGHSAGFSTVDRLWRAVGKKIPKAVVRQWLSGQDVFTLHRPRRVRFERNHYIVSNRFDQLEADLLDLRSLSQYNDGVNYILAVIDCFSRFVWLRGIKEKTGVAITDAFESIFNEMGHTVITVRTDAGKEFTNNTFQAYLAKKDINYIRTYDPAIKCAIIERFIRTIKGRLWSYFTHKSTYRYTDVLTKLASAYNNTYHRIIRRAPATVDDDNILEVYHNIHAQFTSNRRRRPTLRIGDVVKISVEKGDFEKSYLRNWSEEEFKIKTVIPRKPRSVYRLQDLHGEEIRGLFYALELQRIDHDPHKRYKIDRIIDRRTRNRVKEVLVSWIGHTAKDNTWIRASEVKNLQQ
jgi:hypothetical protein